MNFRIVDSVERELERVVARLETSRIGAGTRLDREFVGALQTLAANPWFFARVDDPPPFGGLFREAHLLDNTYRLIYEIRSAEVVVVSLIHTHRRPGSWHRSLGEAQ